jgi:hypothetical protein
MKTTEELIEEIQELLGSLNSESRHSIREAAEGEVEEAPRGSRRVEPAEPSPPRRKRALRRRRWGRRLRFVGLIALSFAVGAAAARGLALLRTEDRVVNRPARTGSPVEQDVLAWTVWQREPPGAAFVTVLASGGARDPVAVGVPTHTVLSIPGRGLGTVADAGRTGDANLVATTLQSLLQVPIDEAVATPTSALRRLVDEAGGIRIGSETVSGRRAIAYLLGGAEETPELRFLRWQEVVAGVLEALEDDAEALGDVLPPEAVPMFAAAASASTDVVELPVLDVGAGLARPETEAVAALVADRFVVPSGVGREVRLVVLNGNGIPGIGEAVTRALVPAGFRLVSSQNAPTFDVQVTRIVASQEEFLDEARLARELLGVGEVYLGEQPTGVADVSVLIGQDFGGR